MPSHSAALGVLVVMCMSFALIHPTVELSAVTCAPPPGAPQAVLTPRVREAVLAAAEETFEFEEECDTVVPLRGDHDALLSLGQRSLMLENFNNARAAGMDVMEAQRVALKGAADGKLYAQPVEREEEEEDAREYTGATMVNRQGTTKVTCMACHHTMSERNLVLQHYRSDWHLLNTRRKLADLRPVSEGEFKLRVGIAEAKLREEDEQREERERVDNPIFLLPDGSAVSEGAAMMIKKANLLSKQRSRVAGDIPPPEPDQRWRPGGVVSEGEGAPPVKLPVRGPKEKTERERAREERRQRAAALRNMQVPCEEVPVREIPDLVDIVPTRCPFCAHTASDIHENIEHMEVRHAFILPSGEALRKMLSDAHRGVHEPSAALPLGATLGELLNDAEGLLCFMLRKVHLGYCCISCGRSFNSIPSTMAHMRETGHCRLPDDEQLIMEEYGPYGAATWVERYCARYRRGASEEGGSELEEMMASMSVEGDESGQRNAEPKGSMSNTIRNKQARILKRASVIAQREQRRERCMLIAEKMKEHRKQGIAPPKGWRESEYARRVVSKEKDPHKVSAGLLPTLTPGVGNGWSQSSAVVARQSALQVSKAKNWVHKHNEIKVWVKNYYTRKAKLGKQPLGILNSGYRA